MKTFLSWSGQRSRLLAMALRDWLPLVLYYIEPWLSERDIAAGDRWTLEVGKELEESNFGIICLTRENLDAPWILFEAGALSKALATGAVCPYLLDIEFRDIIGPLSQFQAKKAEKVPTFEMIQAINLKSAEPIDAARLTELFDILWPKLQQRLSEIPLSQYVEQSVRTQPEILEELVEAVRSLNHRFRRLESKALYNRVVKPSTMFIGTEAVEGFRVQMQVDGDIGKLKSGGRFSFIVTGPTFVDDLATCFEFDTNGFSTSWWLYDPQRKRRLTSEDCLDISSYFGDTEAFLVLTMVPF